MFSKWNSILATWQPKKLRKILTNAKFEENPLPPPFKEVGLSPCNDCIYHRCGYLKPCKSFQFKANSNSLIWHYKRYFNCDSKNVIYILICNTCEWFYLRQATNLMTRIRKHKSNVFHSRIVFVGNVQNSCVIIAEWKKVFLEYTHFHMRIKRNYASLKKNVSLWNGNHSLMLIYKSLSYG